MCALVSSPGGITRSLQRALEVEAIDLDQPTRVSGPTLLLNPRRLEIVLAAAAYPGLHVRSLSRLLLVPLPSLRFHVEKLEGAGLLQVRRGGRRTSAFLPSLWAARDEPFLVAWENPVDRRVMHLVRTSPGIPESALRRQIVPDAGVVTRSLRRLVRCGALRVRGAHERRCTPTAAWTRFERSCRAGAGARLERFLLILREQGLRPMLEEASTERARISVDGPRFRLRFVLPLNPLSRVE